MALPLAAMSLVLAASNVAAMAPSVEGICANKERSFTESGHAWVACGLGRCNGEKGKCENGTKTWISFSFVPEALKDTPDAEDRIICREQCVNTSGASRADAKNPDHNGPVSSSGSASDSDTAKAPEEAASAPAPAPAAGGKDVGAAVPASGEDEEVAAGGTDEMAEDDAVAMEDAATPVAVADEDMAPTMAPAMAPAADKPCRHIVDALTMLDMASAAALATVAGKVLDPASLALLLDPAANLTVFVPPEDAVLRLVGGLDSGALALDDASAILRLHVVTEPLLAEMLIEMEGDALPTALGADDMLLVGLDGDTVTLTANNTVLVTAVDLEGCSETQVIHRVDGLLIPEGLEVDIAALPLGDLSDVEALPPAQGGAPLAGDRGAADGAAGMAGALAAGALAAVALLAL